MKFRILFLIAVVSVPAIAEQKPNVLFIVADDMGYADVGFQGCKDIPTPNIDALAASGVQFTDGYVTGPYCSPSRAGLLTARYQQRFGHEFNIEDDVHGLPITETTIADRLKTAGYTTGVIGKWHLGHSTPMQPQQRGFDEFFGFLEGAHSFFDAKGILRGTEQIDEMDYTTDAFGREAVSFIDRHKGSPWFLYLSFNAVHTPMHATKERLAQVAHIEDQRRRTYAAMTIAMDEQIGSVMKKLVESGLENNTLVFFISDNGGPTMKGVTINGSSNLPLRGSKRTTLEGGIRVPFVLSWPGTVEPAVYHEPALHLDLSATALAVAGVEVKPEWNLDGINLLPYLSGEKTGPPHKAIYWRFGNQMAIRKGDFKLVRYDTNADTQVGKRGQPVTEAKLYNLREDLGETKDLASTQPERMKELQAQWDAWDATLVKPLWGQGSEKAADDGSGEPIKRRKRDAK